MATQVRRDPSRFGKPRNDRAANAAITSIVAEGAFGQRKDTLRKQYESLNKRAKVIGQGLEGSADTASRFNEATAGQIAALNRQEAALQELARRRDQAIKQQTPKLQADFAEQYQQKGWYHDPKKYQTRFGKYIQQNVAAAISYTAAAKAYEEAYRRVQGRTVQQQRLQADYEKARKRATRVQRRAVAAYDRYNKFSKVVRYTP